MATAQELEDLQLQEVEELTVETDPTLLTGRSVVLHDANGNAKAFSASVLYNAALVQTVTALANRVTALENKSFQHLTLLEWQAIEAAGTAVPGKWYLVYSDSTLLTLQRIYIGSELIAKRASTGSVGFPYTFPITF